MLLAGILLALPQAPSTGAQAAAAPAAEPPRARGWDEFPVFVWREKYAGKPLPEELAQPFGGVILMREEDSSWARERGLSYLVWNVAGRDALHLDADEAWNARVEKWIETRDEKLLVREPCLNDPKTVERLFATMDATLAKHGEHPGLGFVLGDEVSLTPNGDPFDLCRCELCEEKWKEFAKANGLPEHAPLTDEVRLALLEDDFSLLGAWLARRRTDRERVLEILESLSKRIHGSAGFEFLPGTALYRKGDQNFRTAVGLLGIGAPSAFGSIDLANGLPFLDFVECYPATGTRELLNALPERTRRDRQGYATARSRASLATLFMGEETPDGAAWKAWEHWLRGGNGLVLWSDRTLDPAHTTRLARAVADIRSIERTFPRLLPPTFSRIAVVTDADSVALAWLKDALLDGATWPRRRNSFQEELGTREQSVRRWLRQIEDGGALPATVPLSRLGELCFGGCNTLVLSHLLVLGPEDVAQLEHQLDFGATLVVDGPLGWVDRNGQPWKEDVMARLRARAPERVRTTLDHLQDSVSGWKPVFSGEAGKLPWLISTRLTEPFFDVPSDDTLVTALPNPRPREGATASGSLHLEVQPPPGYELEWIHPANGSELPAGDAAVFLLRRTPEAR